MVLKEYIKGFNDSLLEEVSSTYGFCLMERTKTINIAQDKIVVNKEEINRAVITSENGLAIILIDKGYERYFITVENNAGELSIAFKTYVTPIDEKTYIADYTVYTEENGKIKQHKFTTTNSTEYIKSNREFDEEFIMTKKQKRKFDQKEFQSILKEI